MRLPSKLFSLVLSLLCICVLFLGYTQAEYFDVSPLQPQVLQNISQLTNPLSHFISMFQRISPLISSNYHGSAEETFITIPSETVVSILDESQNYTEFFHTIRMVVVQSLLDTHYSKFNTQPYEDGNNAIVLDSGDFRFLKTIETIDSLDELLLDKLSLFEKDFIQIQTLKTYVDFNAISITPEEYEKLGSVFLFKEEQDLRDLGYELISWKTRANVDKDYRRYNIMTAFQNIGNLRVLMPNETFNLAREIHANPRNGKTMYVSGYATAGAGATWTYGGGLCGVATAIYQGALTNRGIQFVEHSPHTTYYRNLFDAEINGTRISTPGLDATIYSSKYNLQLKNIRDYPIILVLNFGGGESDPEQAFTLSQAQDRGTFEFVGRRGMCFTWKINGENKTSCYSYIKNS